MGKDEKRALRPYDPFGVFRDFEDMFPSLPSFFRRGFPFYRGSSIPAVDVFEEKERYVIKAEVPGFTKDDIKVNLEGSKLELIAKKEGKEEIGEGTYKRQEIYRSELRRELSLPEDTDLENVPEASLKDGILELSFKRVLYEGPKKVKIEVK